MARYVSDTKESFVQRVAGWLEALEYEVFETPDGSEADLVAETNTDRMIVVCPFLQHMAGAPCLQKAIAAQGVFHASMKLVVSNMPFTAQARTFAYDNHIITVGGNELNDFFNIFRRKVQAELAQSNKRPGDIDYWTLADMEERYGLSGAEIVDGVIPAGLPCYMVGSEYRFRRSDVKKWELETRRLRYGQNLNYLRLPYYNEYRTLLDNRMKKAKMANDRDGVKAVREKAKNRDPGKVCVIDTV